MALRTRAAFSSPFLSRSACLLGPHRSKQCQLLESCRGLRQAELVNALGTTRFRAALISEAEDLKAKAQQQMESQLQQREKEHREQLEKLQREMQAESEQQLQKLSQKIDADDNSKAESELQKIYGKGA